MATSEPATPEKPAHTSPKPIRKRPAANEPDSAAKKATIASEPTSEPAVTAPLEPLPPPPPFRFDTAFGSV
eukprot:5368340-Alexandrium_andersonii.AAC.1